MGEIFAASLRTVSAIAIATIDCSGMLIEANTGFLRLIDQKSSAANSVQVGQFFIQPEFALLINLPSGIDGEIYQGLLTLGEYMGLTRTLYARIWRQENHLQLLAEYDIASLEHLNETVLQLNSDYAKAQFEISQINLRLKQREAELEQTVAQLKVTNIQLKTAQKQLVESEKMASLGVLVAGVAHEINTPLGICLGSNSLMEQQSQALAQKFTERRMTQADLDGFLSKAMQETQLIDTNLNRISQITDSFHQLAVADQATIKHCFNFKQCLEDVVISLEHPLSSHTVVVNIHCDQSLTIDSFKTDWASIFINLITNSLQHGFKDRKDGTIDIVVTTEREMLAVDYSDNGVGLTAEVQSRVFDPFFTTDLQQGMGLGMHLIYNLMTQKLKGRIDCVSPLGQGAHFHIEAPL